jgi:hypothetical protein
MTRYNLNLKALYSLPVVLVSQHQCQVIKLLDMSGKKQKLGLAT